MKIELEIKKERIADSDFYFVAVVEGEDRLLAGAVFDTEADADRTVTMFKIILSHAYKPIYSYQQVFESFVDFYNEHKDKIPADEE